MEAGCHGWWRRAHDRFDGGQDGSDQRQRSGRLAADHAATMTGIPLGRSRGIAMAGRLGRRVGHPMIHVMGAMHVVGLDWRLRAPGMLHGAIRLHGTAGRKALDGNSKTQQAGEQ